ncbi:MAG: hypothetical protein K6F33_05090, partial [Bacteroidales bacterium]|nr:hypothetical protein [Bacteroidales bacterium]
EDSSGWQTSDRWPYGRWKGGNSNAMPDGVGISVIYDKKVMLNEESAIDNPVRNKMAERGDKVIDGCYHLGNFRYGIIIYSDGTKETIRP